MKGGSRERHISSYLAIPVRNGASLSAKAGNVLNGPSAWGAKLAIVFSIKLTWAETGIPNFPSN